MPAYQKIMQLEEAELVCRMAEAFGETERPAGMSADDAVAAMPPDTRYCWLRVSRAVKGYWDECYNNAPFVH
jgi:hypothetical protein